MTSHMSSLQSFFLLGPEIILVAAALIAFLGGAFAGLRSGWSVAVIGILAAMLVAGGQPAEGAWVESGGIRIDAFSTYIRWMVLALGAILALVQAGDLFRSAVTRGGGFGGGGFHAGGTCEEAGTFLILLAGLSLAAVADDLVLLFIGLELVSIPTYILLALKRTDAHGQEASLKYFFLSLVASALFLYAAVCLYGIGGSTSLSIIGARLRSSAEPLIGMSTVLLPVAIGMAMAGAAFRLAAVPMQFYAPDVYEGTSPSNAALLSTLPKVAGIVVLVRVLALAILPADAGDAGVGGAATAHLALFWPLAATLAAVTMTVGNVMALMQRNLRRLLACSSIAHAGYLLVGIATAAAAASARAGSHGPNAADTSWTLGLGGLSATLFGRQRPAAAARGDRHGRRPGWALLDESGGSLRDRAVSAEPCRHPAAAGLLGQALVGHLGPRGRLERGDHSGEPPRLVRFPRRGSGAQRGDRRGLLPADHRRDVFPHRQAGRAGRWRPRGRRRDARLHGAGADGHGPAPRAFHLIVPRRQRDREDPALKARSGLEARTEYEQPTHHC